MNVKKQYLVCCVRMFYKDNKEVIFTDSGRQINGDVRAKKNSVTESVHSKTRFSDMGDNEEDNRLVATFNYWCSIRMNPCWVIVS